MKPSYTPDLVIEKTEGNPIAVVEIRGRRHLSSSTTAIEMRSDLLASDLPGGLPYFLLLSQDIGYLWKGSESNSPTAPPTCEFPMKNVIARFSPGSPEKDLFRSVLSLVVLQWLTHLSAKPYETTEEPEQTLARAGFNDAINDAFVLIEVAL